MKALWIFILHKKEAAGAAQLLFCCSYFCKIPRPAHQSGDAGMVDFIQSESGIVKLCKEILMAVSVHLILCSIKTAGRPDNDSTQTRVHITDPPDRLLIDKILIYN